MFHPWSGFGFSGFSERRDFAQKLHLPLIYTDQNQCFAYGLLTNRLFLSVLSVFISGKNLFLGKVERRVSNRKTL